MAAARRRPGEQIVPKPTAWEVAEHAHTLLDHSGEPMGRGLTAEERRGIEERFGFRFAAVHRAFLAIGVPRGPMWPSWRAASPRDVRQRLRIPVDGVVLDVLEHDFWPTRWGARPPGDDERATAARAQLGRVPTLVPLFGRCYLPAADQRPGCPVLAVDRTSVVRVGHDLAHFVGRELAAHDTAPSGRPLRVPFWSDLAEMFDPHRRRPGIMAP